MRLTGFLGHRTPRRPAAGGGPTASSCGAGRELVSELAQIAAQIAGSCCDGTEIARLKSRGSVDRRWVRDLSVVRGGVYGPRRRFQSRGETARSGEASEGIGTGCPVTIRCPGCVSAGEELYITRVKSLRA